MPLKPKLIEGYVDYPAFWEKIKINEVEKNSILLVPYREIVDFLQSLSSTKGPITDLVAIISEPEPEIEKASEYGVIANWLSTMGIQHYGVRVSGHYYPYQIKSMLSIVKPRRKVEVMHTLRPELFHTLLERAR